MLSHLLFCVKQSDVGERDSELHPQMDRVVLANTRPFRLGGLEVHPATRQLVAGASAKTAEPRIMQVLVALAEHPGRIITRDELVERCWQGHIVGDDAVNRALSRVRQLASATDPPAFTVETIPRVGYRLIASDTPPTTARLHHPTGSFDRRAVMVGGTALVVTAVAIGSSELRKSVEPAPREARQLFERAFVLRFSGQPEDNRQAMAYLRDATRIAPRYGEAWGALALAYRDALDSEASDRTEGFNQLLAEAVGQADRYDPGNADAAAARVPFSGLFGHWAKYQATARSLIAAHSNHPFGHELLGTVLMDVGRWREAIGPLRTAEARNAFSPIIPYKLTTALWSSGAISEADAESDAALRRWPQHGAVWQTKLKLLMLTGRPRAAADLANDPAAQPITELADQFGARNLVLRALISRWGSDEDKAVELLLSQLRSAPGNALPTAVWCAALNRLEIALTLVEGLYLGLGPWSSLYADVRSKVTHPLFQPPMQPLWDEPRFTNVVNRIALGSYWRDTATLPDYRRPPAMK